LLQIDASGLGPRACYNLRQRPLITSFLLARHSTEGTRGYDQRCFSCLARAAVLTAQIVDIHRFATEGKLVGYFGVFPVQASSGLDRQGKPRAPKRYVMCPRGSDLVRRYLYLAALSAAQHNPAVQPLYQRVRAKHPDHPASNLPWQTLPVSQSITVVALVQDSAQRFSWAALAAGSAGGCSRDRLRVFATYGGWGATGGGVQEAAHGAPSVAEYARMDHGRVHAGMPEQFLHRPKCRSRLRGGAWGTNDGRLGSSGANAGAPRPAKDKAGASSRTPKRRGRTPESTAQAAWCPCKHPFTSAIFQVAAWPLRLDAGN